jgi:hypothetical protein
MISERLNPGGYTHTGANGNVILYIWISVFLLTGLMTTWGCRQNPGIQQEGLYGKWDIVRAIRNGKETHYLRGGYFIIEPNGSMTINITGSDETGPYSLVDNTLKHNNKKDFVIESLHQDSLSVRYTMNAQNNFLFILSKNKDAAR